MARVQARGGSPLGRRGEVGWGGSEWKESEARRVRWEAGACRAEEEHEGGGPGIAEVCSVGGPGAGEQRRPEVGVSDRGARRDSTRGHVTGLVVPGHFKKK